MVRTIKREMKLYSHTCNKCGFVYTDYSYRGNVSEMCSSCEVDSLFNNLNTVVGYVKKGCKRFLFGKNKEEEIIHYEII